MNQQSKTLASAAGIIAIGAAVAVGILVSAASGQPTERPSEQPAANLVQPAPAAAAPSTTATPTPTAAPARPSKHVTVKRRTVKQQVPTPVTTTVVQRSQPTVVSTTAGPPSLPPGKHGSGACCGSLTEAPPTP